MEPRRNCEERVHDDSYAISEIVGSAAAAIERRLACDLGALSIEQRAGPAGDLDATRPTAEHHRHRAAPARHHLA